VKTLEGEVTTEETIAWFVGIDWGSQRHQVCVVDTEGNIVGEREFPHSGSGLAEWSAWLLSVAGAVSSVAVAIEVPHGPVVVTTRASAHCVVRPGHQAQWEIWRSARTTSSGPAPALVLAKIAAVRAEPETQTQLALSWHLLGRRRPA
jgi:hypothetical protein